MISLRSLRIVATALVLLGFSAGRAAADPLFGAPIYFGSGTQPSSIHSGDFDGDGHFDLVATNYASTTVSVLLGTGTGTFGPATLYTVGSNPWAGAVGDVNGDGKLDLAIANWGSGTVSVLLGDGHGAFGPKTDYDIGAGAGGHPWSVEISDTDNDGSADLVVANNSAGTVTVLRRNLSGVFVPAAVLSAGISPTSVAVDDLDGDGAKDLVVVSYDSNDVRVYWGNGNGTFAGPLVLTSLRRPLNVKVGDMNRDGKKDIVVDGFGTGDALVYSATGLRTFSGGAPYPVGLGPYWVEIADLNGDDWPDLAVANNQGANVSILLNNKVGGFLPHAEYAAGPGSQSIAIRDYNGDGHPDLAVADFNAASAAILLNLAPANTDRPPVITAPATVTGNEGSLITFDVTASDPDGDFIAFLTASGPAMEAGGSFVPVVGNSAGTFSWTPAPTQGGQSYDLFLSASSCSRAGSISGEVVCVTETATTTIFVNDVDRAPVVSAPSSVSGFVGTLVSFSVVASDPDGQGIGSLTAAPLPAGASFTTVVNKSSGSFAWTPALGQIGSYPITFTASNGLTGTAVTQINVGDGNHPPALAAPASIATSEGSLVSFAVAATDPDGDHVTLGIQNRPVGSTFVDGGNNTGSFTWTPSFSQSGTYAVTLTGTDSRGALATPALVAITVDNLNRAPTASAGGPYGGIVAVPITFNATGSSDPDGDPLGYVWSFGDGALGSGVTPMHSYAAGGTFVVSLSVSDGFDTAAGTTIATIQDVFPARAFTTGGNGTIRLGSGKATWCTQIEPVLASYLNTAVIPSTISMSFGPGRIYAEPGKVAIGGDKDGNGVDELTACFSKADLRTLFAALPHGTNTVTVTLDGALTTGGTFRGSLTVDVVSNGGSLAASLSPNPLNPDASLTFTTSRPGRVRVSVFDLQGRLVRRVMEEGTLSAGYHDVRVDGKSEDGSRLPSGVYFYRVEAEEGTAVGRVVIAK